MTATFALRDMPTWPAALAFDEAVAYTGMAETEMRRHARSGAIRFLPRGPNGRMIAQRVDLDALLNVVFANENGQPVGDMDFG